MTTTDIDWLRHAYEALNRGEWNRSTEFMHPEISWHFVEGQGPDVPETLQGPQAIVQFWGDFFEAWDEWEMTPSRFEELPDGGLLVTIHFHARGINSGLPMELDYCQVIALRDGRIHRVDQYSSPESARKACGLDA